MFETLAEIERDFKEQQLQVHERRVACAQAYKLKQDKHVKTAVWT